MSDRITLRNMVFYAYHGVFEAERELGQRFEVDVELHRDLRQPGKTDDLDLTVNYADVYTVVKETVEDQECNLVEAVAEAIADRVLSGFDLEAVVVRVRKPHVPVGGLTGGVEVEIRRTAG